MNRSKEKLLAFISAIFTLIFIYEYMPRIGVDLKSPPISKNYVYLPQQETISSTFEDLYFRPLLTAFKYGWENLAATKRIFRSGTIPSFFLVTEDKLSNSFWRQQLLHISLGQCPLPCRFTGDPNELDFVDAVVFYLRHLKDEQSMYSGFPKRDPAQPWVMLSFEAAPLANSIYRTNYSRFNGKFNRTMMPRTDADVFTPHGFIVRNEDAPLLPEDWVLPPPDLINGNFTRLKKRKLVVAFISNCNAGSGRLQYIEELQKSIGVDVYGKCGKFQCGHSRYVDHGYRIKTDKCFQMAGIDYMFYLAFENAVCKDYASEKLYNLLYYPIVPIVLGGAEYSKILPPHSYIDAAGYSPEELAKHLLFLQQHPEEYNKYLTWRKFYRPSTVGGIRSLCLLCVKLYDPTFYAYKVYEDFYKWFYTDANCSRKWTLDRGIINI